MKKQNKSKIKGITLIEMILVIGLISMIAVISIPSYYAIVKSSRKQIALKSITDTFAECRGQAIALRKPIFLEFNDSMTGMRKHYWQVEQRWNNAENKFEDVKIEKYSEYKLLPDDFVFEDLNSKYFKFNTGGSITDETGNAGVLEFKLKNIKENKEWIIEVVGITGRVKVNK